MGKVIAVLGLGDFGRSVVGTLAKLDCQILAVDENEENVQAVAGYVTRAIIGNLADYDFTSSLGLEEVDDVVIGTGNNLEAAIVATMAAKEAGVGRVIAKVNSDIQTKVLKKLGCDETIYVEKYVGDKVAHNLVKGSILEYIELSDTYSMMEMNLPSQWVGKTLAELDLRKNYGFNVVAMKHDDKFYPVPDLERKTEREDRIVLIGDTKKLEKLMR